MKIFKRVVVVGAAAAALLLLAAIVVLRTDWFRDFVRRKIIAATEEATGGRVEIASFDLDWRALRATVHDFTIHGTEPAGVDPFVTARTLVVELKIFSGLYHAIDLRRVAIEEPRVNIIVNADGSTNIPSPKLKKKPGPKTALETVVDLAVNKFELNRGSIQYAGRKTPLDVRGGDVLARLDYNPATPRYQGHLSISPLHLRYGGNRPLDLDVRIPVTIERDRVRVAGARVATKLSELIWDAELAGLRNPVIGARVKGRLALPDAKRFAGFPLTSAAPMLEIDTSVRYREGALEVGAARFTLGGSHLEASGVLSEALRFKTALNLDEISRLLGLNADPRGILRAAGTARLRGAELAVDGNTDARGVSFRLGERRFENVDLSSSFRAGNAKIELQAIRIGALGARFSGKAVLEALERLTVDGRLDDLDIHTAGAHFLKQLLPYQGVISGPVRVTANLKTPAADKVDATVNLAIAPGVGGIPVSGRIDGAYRGAAGEIDATGTYLQLPNSRLALDGPIGQMRIDLSSRDLRDFVQDASFPLVLRGPARFSGMLSGSLDDPALDGRLTLGPFLMQGRRFDGFSAGLSANPAKAALRNAILSRGAMRTSIEASLGLHGWRPLAESPLAIVADVRNGDLADIVALANQSIPLSGPLTANANITGTLGDPAGFATVLAGKGAAYGEPFDRIEARVDFTGLLVSVPSATVYAGPARVGLTGSYRHPPGSFASGRIEARLASTGARLENLRRLMQEWPGIAGGLAVNAHVTGDIGNSGFVLAGVDGDVNLHGLRAENEAFGDMKASVRTVGQTVSYTLESDLAKSAIRVSGSTQLSPGYPTQASAAIEALPVERMLWLARRADIPVQGTMRLKAAVAGPIAQLTGNADLTLTDALAYREPVSRLAARVQWRPDGIEIPEAELISGSSRLSLTAGYRHAAGDRANGKLEFRIADSRADLSTSPNLQRHLPGLAGVVAIAADGAAVIQTRNGNTRLLPLRLTADVTAADLRRRDIALGGFALRARTNGDTLDFKLTSGLTQARIQGEGRASLRGDYPLQAQLSVDNLTYSGLLPLLPAGAPVSKVWGAEAALRLTVSGPLIEPSKLVGDLEMPTLRVTASASAAAKSRLITLENPSPIRVTIDRDVLRIRSARLIAPETDIRFAGAIPWGGDGEMNLNLSVAANIGVVQDLSRDIYASGRIVMQAVARGTLAGPRLNGRLELRNASLNYIELPNGLSNANGVVVFNGRSVNIQTLTAESGGGKIDVNGFAALNNSGGASYNLRANARQVRVRMPNGLNVVATANARLTGNSQRSLLSGVTTVESLGFSPRQDFGSMLSRTAEPVETPDTPRGPLQGMRLDIKIRTAPSASFVTAMAQNLQADADLTLRGTLASPGLIGRVNITEGELLFFGSQYRVSQGTVAFYNPARIEPVLNVDLQTVAKGVAVNLNVAGPIDNMKLTYTSDPPLQFNEVVALLATGRTPSSDPSLLAREPAAPQQSLQQMGGSAILSAAVANPVSSRLARVFGVSKLKIDPSFTSGSELPQARLTLQQQITSRITFTYITNLAQTNAQIARMEWAFDDSWSAIATREENGRFGIDFFFKKQFR